MRRVIRAALAMASSAVPLVPAAGDEPRAPGAASCLACHASGDGLPDLGTLSSQAIEAALAAYRDGTREGTIMPRIAKGFSAAEARAIAESLERSGRASR